MSAKGRIQLKALVRVVVAVALLIPWRNRFVTDVPGYGYPLPLYISWPWTECSQKEYLTINLCWLCFDFLFWLGAWWELAFLINLRSRRRVNEIPRSNP